MLIKIVPGASDPRRSRFRRWQCNKCGAILISDDFYKDVKVEHAMTDFIFRYTCPSCGQSAMGMLDNVRDAFYTASEVEEMSQ